MQRPDPDPAVHRLSAGWRNLWGTSDMAREARVTARGH